MIECMQAAAGWRARGQGGGRFSAACASQACSIQPGQCSQYSQFLAVPVTVQHLNAAPSPCQSAPASAPREIAKAVRDGIARMGRTRDGAGHGGDGVGREVDAGQQSPQGAVLHAHLQPGDRQQQRRG